MAAKEYRDGWTAVLVRFTDEVAQDIDIWRAQQPGVSPSKTDVIRRAVNEFLLRNPVQRRRSSQRKAAGHQET
jgi:hypothetical protein